MVVCRWRKGLWTFVRGVFNLLWPCHNGRQHAEENKYNLATTRKIRLKMKILKTILINLVVVFVLLEGGMRIYYAVSDGTPPNSIHSIEREWRWVTQRLEDGKVNFDPRFTYDQYAGWKNAPNIDTTDAYGSRIRTNSHGMRNDEEFPPARTGKPRLLIIGDSYSFGYGVANDETFAHILGKQYLPEWEVMNLAVSATGTDQQYLMYEHYGEKFGPQIVLLGFYLRDYHRNTISFRDYAKPMYVPQADGSLQLTHSPVTAPGTLIAQYQNGEKQIGGWDYSYAYAAFAQKIRDSLRRDRSPGSLGARTLSGIMEKYVTRVRANGAVPVWVNIPVRDITKEPENKYDEVEAFATQEAKRLGMPVLTLEPVFLDYLEQHPDAALWRPREIGGHMSALGNKVAAGAIYRFLTESNLLSAELQQQH
jgi:hypothetical protein